MTKTTLANLRVAKSKAKRDVARDLDITERYLDILESGKQTPSLKLARKIALYYNSNIESIFFSN